MTTKMTKTNERLALVERQRRFEWQLARAAQTQAAAKFVAHTACRHQREAKSRLCQALLRRQAVDHNDIGGVQAGAQQLTHQHVAG